MNDEKYTPEKAKELLRKLGSKRIQTDGGLEQCLILSGRWPPLRAREAVLILKNRARPNRKV
ncbi:MAG: hypothetical protein Q8P01_02715 [bacterium]|nr:hypothetical protein [bacterium]